MFPGAGGQYAQQFASRFGGGGNWQPGQWANRPPMQPPAGGPPSGPPFSGAPWPRMAQNVPGPWNQQQPHMARGGRSRGALAHSGPALNHPQGQVPGPGTGQSDGVPAYLSKDEYVVPADVVSHLGEGSSNAGAQRLDGMVDRVRKKRTGNTKFPPRADALSLGK